MSDQDRHDIRILTKSEERWNATIVPLLIETIAGDPEPKCYRRKAGILLRNIDLIRELLIEFSCSPVKGLDKENLALRIAVEQCRQKAVWALLSGSRDAGKVVDAQDVQGRTHLHAAIMAHSHTSVEYLLYYGANVDAVDVNRKSPRQLVFDLRADLKMRSYIEDGPPKRWWHRPGV